MFAEVVTIEPEIGIASCNKDLVVAMSSLINCLNTLAIINYLLFM